MKLTSGLAAVALAATTLAAQPASAAAPVPPTQLAADWSAGQLADGLVMGQYGADVGLSVDAGLAFHALGRTADADRVADAIADRLVTSETNPYGYVASDEYDEGGNVVDGYYANATAKAAAFSQRVGRDPETAYAAVDLIAQLEDLTDDESGLIADVSVYGNYENTIGQAFAVEALTAAASDEASTATDALLAQQCPAGYFRFDLDAAACSADTAGVAPDTTALVVLSLLESGDTSTEVASAITEATAWLQSVQLANGSFDGDASAPGSNSNSTGLAGWALGDAGRTAPAAKAAAWVRSMQVADAGACVSQAPTGAIAYNAEDLAAAGAAGITGNATTQDKWRRAAFQAAPVLRWAPAATTPLSISTPATAVEKSSVTATVRGLAAGEQGCVSLGGDARRVVGTGADLAVAFTLPAGAAAHTFTLATLGGSTTATTTASLTPVVTVPPVAPVPPVAAKVKIAKVEKVRKNRFKVALVCAEAAPCAGKIKVRTATKVAVDGLKKKKVVRVSEKRYNLAAGSRKQVSLRLTKTARALVADGRLKVKSVATARGGDRVVRTFSLKSTRG
ncbi:hypothetical protein AAII07_02665 [Microvirga sp. 0TCS3.31]